MASIVWVILIAGVMVAALLVPYLVQVIERGEARKRPGQPDGQPEPYNPRARG